MDLAYRVQRRAYSLKTKKNILVALVLFSILYSLFSTQSPVLAACDPANPTPECAPGVIQLTQLMTRLINISVTIAFMALTVWLVWAALKFFITSGGDPKALAHAWMSITWAFLGLFFMVLAWLVLKLIYATTGANVTEFCLGFPPYCV